MALTSIARIEPLLYKVLQIRGTVSSTTNKKILRPSYVLAPASLMASRSFSERVRDVIFVGDLDDEDIVEILSVCRATVNVVIDIVGGSARRTLAFLGGLPLQRLSANLGWLFTRTIMTTEDFTHPLFSHITHLHIYGPQEVSAAVALIPRLTHLSFRATHLPASARRSTLDNCTSLKVLVSVWSKHSYLDACASIFADIAADPRFVMLVVPDFKLDWEIGARGGEDYWARAEEVVNMRIAGE
jgi:hypothetical protein